MLQGGSTVGVAEVEAGMQVKSKEMQLFRKRMKWGKTSNKKSASL
jgi:hypothetical protein